MVLAGTDTVSQAMSVFFRHMSGNPDIQARLRAELNSAFDGPVEDMDALTLAKLPYLDACIQESLRLMPPAPLGK